MKNDVWNWEDPERTSFWLIVRLLLVAVTSFLTITMMNIFIGVLSTEYSVC